MAMTSPRCSVVVRCFNEEKHIGKLLDGIMQQTVSGPEVIIVDSGSTDGTLEVAARYPIKILHVSPEEFSFGRSLNKGCAATSANLIVVASAHVYPVYKDWIERLLAPFADPAVGLVYGKQSGDERTKYSERQVFAKWFGDRPEPAQSHPFCNNANAAIRRAVWERLPYDETLTGLEDIAWARGAMALGCRLYYEPAAEVVHVHEETSRQVFNRYRREAIALRRIFPEERFHLWDFLRLYGGNVLSDLYHASRDRTLLRGAVGILAFRLMQFWGTYRGFARRGPVTSHLKQTFYYPRSRRRAGRQATRASSRQPVTYPGTSRTGKGNRAG
jgi:rhamnosyltransferase